MSRTNRQALILAVVGLSTAIPAILLPLHFVANGEFGMFLASPSLFGIRLMIGSIIGGFTLPLVISTGIALLWCRRPVLASGIFLASGTFALLSGLAEPFYALPRLQPMVLLFLRVLTSSTLFLASWWLLRPPRAPSPSVERHETTAHP